MIVYDNFVEKKYFELFRGAYGGKSEPLAEKHKQQQGKIIFALINKRLSLNFALRLV